MIHFIYDENGATAIEYAMIAGLVSVTITVALTIVGEDIESRFQAVIDAFGS